MKKILTAFIALSLSLAAFAGEENVTLPFLRIDQNPVSAAQASISLFDNAASTAWLNGRGYIGAGYQRWGVGPTNNIFVDASGRFIGSLGVRARYAQQLEKPYEMIDGEGESLGNYTPQTLRAMLGVSYAIGKYVSVGVDFSYARRALAPESVQNAFTIDPAVMVRYAGLRAALGTKNLAPAVKSFSGDKFSVPGSAFVSLGYDITFAEVHHIVPAAEFEYMFFGQMSAAGSLCYNWNDSIMLMGGYRYGGFIPSHASAGVGFCIKGLCINATMLFGQGDINMTALVGLGYRF